MYKIFIIYVIYNIYIYCRCQCWGGRFCKYLSLIKFDWLECWPMQAATHLEKPRQAFTCRADVDFEHLTVLEMILMLGHLGWTPKNLPTGKALEEIGVCESRWPAEPNQF